MKLQEAINVIGSKAKVGLLTGLSASAITQWGEEVPVLRQYQLEVITEGRLKSDFTKQRLEQEG